MYAVCQKVFLCMGVCVKDLALSPAHTASPKPFAWPVQVSTCNSVKDSANASALVGKDMCLCRMQRDMVMCVKFGAAV